MVYVVEKSCERFAKATLPKKAATRYSAPIKKIEVQASTASVSRQTPLSVASFLDHSVRNGRAQLVHSQFKILHSLLKYRLSCTPIETIDPGAYGPSGGGCADNSLVFSAIYWQTVEPSITHDVENHKMWLCLHDLCALCRRKHIVCGRGPTGVVAAIRSYGKLVHIYVPP